MNKAVVFFSLLLFTLCVRAQDKQIYLADPTIYAENGTYYLYGTGYSSDIGFTAFTSRDLLKWKGPSGALDGRVLIGGQKAFGTAGFWAPQVFKYNNRYFMAYAANEYIAIASAPSPLLSIVLMNGCFSAHLDEMNLKAALVPGCRNGSSHRLRTTASTAP